jgi:phosphoglycolate phosphatase-like HAD superfamily hydrolase
MVGGAILLFDIDGTLLDAAGGGRRALEAAFQQVYGCPDALAQVDFRGMTDGHILQAGADAIGRKLDEHAQRALIESYLEHLAAAVQSSPDFRVMPGVHRLLTAATVRARVAVGLGTGNIERGARIKLARAGLNHYFEFGGFGSDHEDRRQVLRVAAARGARRLAAELSQFRVVVIGDTPLDVAAARAIGADCVGVATGGYTVTQLREAGCAAVFRDLTDPAAGEAILG